MARRVAVTGLGAISAAGSSVPALWQTIRHGGTGIALAPAAESGGTAWPQARIADAAAESCFSARQRALLDPVSQLALVAAAEAMQSARLAAGPAAAPVLSPAADLDPQRCGAVFAAGLGHQTLDDSYRTLYRDKSRRLHPFTVPRGMPSAATSHLSMAYGLQGPSLATASACASSAHAIALACHFIRSGLLDMAITGGAEASLVPGMVAAWEGLHVLSPDTCRPFSRDRSGLVLGEGAAVLVLEEWQQALRRGAVPLAELLGFGMGADAGDITAPSAEGAARVMRAALADGGVAPDAVDHVNAHGTGTRLNDRSEAQALAAVFGPRLAKLPVSSSKAQIGHCLNAAGALETLITVLALRDGVLPPTMNFNEADPECPLDCVPNAARSAPIRIAMSNSFAFGGLNAVLLLRKAG